jgi:hypothetical protein
MWKCQGSLAGNVLQISEGTNSVGIVRLDLGFCLCAVIRLHGKFSRKLNLKHETKILLK